MNDESRSHALAAAVIELERHAAAGGWDAPVGIYALVRTADALAENPAVATQLGAEVVAAAEADPEHLTSIEQDGLPESANLEELLAQLAWPETVHGAAIVVERIVVPPEAEQGMPSDPEEAVAYLMGHPDRQDVRVAAGVLRSGESWCVLRSRANDSDDAVAGAPDAVPGLVHALAATFS
ncbi:MULTISPECIES: PPA1309 family protein [unclassified Pseudactinotalea]|uniref:PPA1309 family protein n=1 Tax=unclassified Pseudactinotalea TaxID=2649176 RepID=UPI003C7AECF9